MLCLRFGTEFFQVFVNILNWEKVRFSLKNIHKIYAEHQVVVDFGRLNKFSID